MWSKTDIIMYMKYHYTEIWLWFVVLIVSDILECENKVATSWKLFIGIYQSNQFTLTNTVPAACNCMLQWKEFARLTGCFVFAFVG